MEDQWTARLSEYLDGELDAAEREAFDRHLSSCEACRGVLSDLERVVARAGALPDSPPSADLWPGIATRLTPARGITPWWRRISEARLSFTVPQAAAAGLVLVLVSAALSWLARTPARPIQTSAGPASTVTGPIPRPASFADQSYDRAIADLRKALDDRRNSLDPRTYAAIERSLANVDRAIAEARQALDADPGNVYLNSHLAATRRRKLELLRTASALAQSEN